MPQHTFNLLTVSYGGEAKQLILYKNIPIKEVEDCLIASYPDISRQQLKPIAFQQFDQEKIVYPLKTATYSPSLFEDGIYNILTISPNQIYSNTSIPSSDLMNNNVNGVYIEDHSDSDEDMEFLREMDLTDFDLFHLVNVFMNACTSTKQLDYHTFQSCIQTLQKDKPQCNSNIQRMFIRLFTIFDPNNQGLINIVEFLGGASVFTSGDRDTKVKVTFDLYDTDKDGYITLSEMVTYLHSVFLVIAATSPELFQRNSVKPYELSVITANQCFMDSQLPNDGKLSFEAFKKWYSMPSIGYAQQIQSQKSRVSNNSPVSHVQDIDAREAYSNRHSIISTSSLHDGGTSIMRDSVVTVANLIGLSSRSARDVFEILASAVNEDGMISSENFQTVFRTFTSENMETQLPESEKGLSTILGLIFHAFDIDESGYVDFCELASGVSVLCGGTNDEKMHAAFALFDLNHDGYISKDEMETYLRSVFRLIHAATMFISVSENVQEVEEDTTSPDELAAITTTDIFTHAKKASDGRLSFEEFKNWFSNQGYFISESSPAFQLSDYTVLKKSLLSICQISSGKLDNLKQLTNLSSYDIGDVVRLFMASADSSGNLTLWVMEHCFHKLQDKNKTANSTVHLTDTEEKKVVIQLFELFDIDGHGVIDAQELCAGVSMLCGGSWNDKAVALFHLYDKNSDGFISRDEMASFLSGILRVIYHADQQVFDFTHLPPIRLAYSLADDCFKTYDKEHNDLLTLDEFCDWFNQECNTMSSSDKHETQSHFQKNIPQLLSTSVNGILHPITSSSDPIPIEVVKGVLGLDTLTVQQSSDLFFEAANDEGHLTRDDYMECFSTSTDNTANMDSQTNSTYQRYDILQRLFNAFDHSKSGLIDCRDLTSGISVLCSGSNKEIFQSIFRFYDSNSNGYISTDDFIHYLTSVFKVLLAYNPQNILLLWISPSELATEVAAAVSQHVEMKVAGHISFDEFCEWYDIKEGLIFQDIIAHVNLGEVQRITGLGHLDVEAMFEMFAEHADVNGRLTSQIYESCYLNILRAQNDQNTAIEQFRAHLIMKKIFSLYDQDSTGGVDFTDLVSGLSVICRGSQNNKVQAAFRLYDFNGDGYITLDDLSRFLTSIYQVLCNIQPGIAQHWGVSALEFGNTIAKRAFNETFTDITGKLSYEQFRHWVTVANTRLGVGALADFINVGMSSSDATTQWLPLEDLQRLLHISAYDAEHVFEVFAGEANHDGLLTRASVIKAFQVLILAKSTSMSDSDWEDVNIVIHSIFDLFDNNNNGWVDFVELSSGMSVLCGGEKDQKVEAAFALFDFNGDGYITLEEMTRYLTSVFKVLLKVSPEALELNITPEELGQVTAQQAFTEADHDHDGRLTLQEFQQWYQQPGGIGDGVKNSDQLFSLVEAKRLTQLSSFSAMEMFESLSIYADDNGFISRKYFDDCINNIIKSNDKIGDKQNQKHLRAVFDRLFNLFDVNKTGQIDFSELSAGLSVFCGADSNEDIRAAFALYDYNGDGSISFAEMVKYLTSVFRVVCEACPHKLTNEADSPGALALRVAEQAFNEAGIDQSEGRMDFPTFRAWYSTSNAANIERLISSNVPEWLSLREVRRLTNLSAYTPKEVFEVFAGSSSAEGYLKKHAFQKAFKKLHCSRTSNTGDNPNINTKSDQIELDNDRLRILADRLFSLFDTNHDGVVNFSELASGLSVLCGGTENDKIRAAFQLYDANQDGYISLGEMRLYLSAIFRVIFEVNPETETQMGVTPEELAEITAEQAFAEADTDHDGKLSFEEFSKWYSGDSSHLLSQSFHLQTAQSERETADNNIQTESSRRASNWSYIDTIKSLTQLDKMSPQDMFEIFAKRCSDNGTLNYEAFTECFKEIADDDFDPDESRKALLNKVLNQLFRIFDFYKEGAVDFCELCSGLSVLCSGSREEKVHSAFSLFDLDNVGYISREELERYLTSVFNVLYEMSSNIVERLDVSPKDLAIATAEQCFDEANIDDEKGLSFDEFVSWYTRSIENDVEPKVKIAKELVFSKSILDSGLEDTITHSPMNANNSSEAKDADAPHISYNIWSSSNESKFTIDSKKIVQVQSLLKLKAFGVNEMFEILAEAAPGGKLTFPAFKKCFEQIIQLAGRHSSGEERQEADALISQLFDAFDQNKENAVHFGEFAAGLSIYAGSSVHEKLNAVFKLYCVDGTDYITLKQLETYLGSIIRVIMQANNATKPSEHLHSTLEDISNTTLKDLLRELNMNDVQTLSLDEFHKVGFKFLDDVIVGEAK